MNKDSFLNELERLLSDIQESERKEALDYYRDYFEEAGPENEKQVIMDLGSPSKVADIIKMSLNGNNNYGEFSERGYSDPRFETNYEVVNKENTQNSNAGYSNHTSHSSGSYNNTNTNGNYTSKRKQTNPRSIGEIILIVILAILALPIGLPILITILALIISIFAVIISVLVAVAVAGVGLFAGGIVAFIAGIAKLFTGPVAGIAAMGVGLILTGIGAFLIWLMIGICIKIIPPVFAGCINFISKPFQRRRN